MPAKAATARKDRDIFRLAPMSDAATLETIAKRLEFRGTDAGYVQLSQAYFDQLPLVAAHQILAVGCGTGLEIRALKRRTRTAAAIVGIDHSPALIEVAERLTREEGLANGIQYQVGDAHHLPFDDACFDIVLLHTLLSHVDNPLQVLGEARRVARPGGTITIFDGDYASLTWAYPDPARAKEIEEQLLQMVVANPRVMRDLPRFIQEVGLELVSGTGVLYANIGSGGFWVNAADLFGAVLARSGMLPRAVVEEWQHYQVRAVESNTFFGASNYYTYHARRPR
jgi:ubiquinone/menaquinone biosynthesis C-methylase UbiE